MKPRRKLKNWVKITLLFLPEIVMIIQLFFVGIKLEKIIDNFNKKECIESRCYCD